MFSPRIWIGHRQQRRDGDGERWRESLACEFHGGEFGYYSVRTLCHGAHNFVYNPNDVNELYDRTPNPTN